HRRVDVGAEHQRLAPRAHRAVRIVLLRGAEGAPRLGMIEAIGQAQALVEIALRNGTLGGDRRGERAEIVEQRRITRRRIAARSLRRRKGLRFGRLRKLLVVAEQDTAVAAVGYT